MIFCHCAVVGEREVTAAVDAGAETVAAVCKATGAGRDCGACIFSVRRVLCDHQAQQSGRSAVQAPTAIGVDVAAS